MEDHSEKVSFIWSVADLLRGDYKAFDYGKVILPFTVLRRLTMFAALCLSPIAARAESWVCIAEKSAGFHEEAGIWSPTIFSTSTKLIIKPLDLSDEDVRLYYDRLSKHMTDEEKLTYEYYYQEFGYSFISGLCDASSYDHAIYCRAIGGGIPNEELIVNLRLMRFQRYHPYGYLFGSNETAKLTPFLEIGTCSPL